jgi:autotransporter translocation and assembly factor TamB
VSLPFVLALFPGGRAFIRDQGLSFANKSLPWHASVGSLDRLDPWGVDARNIALVDEHGVYVAKLGVLSVRLNPFPLIGGRVQLNRVQLARAYVDVDGLLAADKKPDEPEEEEKDDGDQESGLQIQADQVALLDARIKTGANGHTYLANVVQLRASGGYGPRTSLVLAALDARVSDEQGALAYFGTKYATFAPEKGGSVSIAGAVLETRLALSARIGAIPSDGSWPEGKAELHVGTINRALFERLGVSGVSLNRPLDLTVRAAQTGGDLDAAVTLEDARRELLQLTAHGKPQDATVRLELSPLNLQALMAELPDMDVTGKLEARYTEKALHDAAWRVAWQDVRVNAEAIPPGDLRGGLLETAVRVDALTVQGLEKALELHGSFDWERTVADIALLLRPTRLESVSWLRARGYRGRVNVDVALRGGQTGPVDGKAVIGVDGLASPGLSVRQANLKLAVDGTMNVPLAHGKVDVQNLLVDTARIERIGLDFDAHDENVDASFRIVSDKARVSGSAQARKVERELSVLARAAGVVRDSPLRFRAQATRVDEGATEGKVNLTIAEQSIAAQGSLSAQDDLRASLRARALNLAFWGALFKHGEVAGMVDLEATASGKTAAPKVALNASLRDVRGFGQPDTDAQIKADANLATRHYTLSLEAKGKKDPLHASVSASVVLPKHATTLEGWLRGPYDAHARMRVPARRLGALDKERLGPLRGQVQLALDAQGGNRKINAKIDVDALVRLPTVQDDRSDRLRASIALDETDTSVHVLAHDRDGELMRVDGKLEWPNGSIFAAAGEKAWQELPTFNLNAKLSDRRIDEMQGVWAYFAGIYEVDMPIKVGVNLALLGNEHQLSGGINGRALIMADALDKSCALGTQIQSSFDAKIDKDVLEASVWAREMSGGSVNLNAKQALHVNPNKPASEWLGAATVELKGKSISMRSLPGMCQLTSGRASFVAQASALDGRPPRATIELGLEDVSAHPDHKESIALELYAGLSDKQVQAQGKLHVQSESRGSFSAELPLVSHGKEGFPELAPNAQLKAKLALDKLPVAPFLAVGDLLGRPSGAVSARLAVTGPLDKPKPDGYLELHDVSFSVASSAQPLHRMRGRVEVHDNVIKIRELTAHDGGGSLRVDGQVHFNDNATGEGKLTLRANKLPLRRQGEIVGELTLRTDVEARMPASHMAEIEVMLREGRIWLTGDKGRTVQSLEPDPEIEFVDVPMRKREAEKKEEAQVKMGFAWMKIKTDKDLWIMHEDFSVQLGVNIRFVNEDDAPAMRGEVEIRRGELTLLGKVFKIQKGAVRFTGDAPPDPDLEVKAAYRLPKGEDLVVSVTGRSSAPVLAFSGAADNIGDAVALLSGVGKTGAESKAEDDARNFAANLTAGLLTVAARREFGDWVPVLGVENDETGAVSGARAGFDASKLIPPALRGFARAAYVEGVVGSTQANGNQIGVGVRVEVVLPADIVTSWGYGPGATWATDVAWAP